MDPTRIGLFDLAEQRLAWTDKRQEVLAQNIANLDTPGFRPRDLPSFAGALRQASSAAPVRTQPGHMAGTSGDLLQAMLPERPALHAPDGNAVSLDEQLVKVTETGTNQALVTSIYKKYVGLFGLALGRSG
jgi:flagellar basal-body rod protein FlgB